MTQLITAKKKITSKKVNKICYSQSLNRYTLTPFISIVLDKHAD